MGIKRGIILTALLCLFCVPVFAAEQHKVIARKTVVANGEIGADGYSAGESWGGSTNYIYYESWTPTTAGTIRYLRTYLSGAGDACLLILSDSGGNPSAVLGSCTISNPGDVAWHHCDMGSDVTLVGGTTYHLAKYESSADVIFYESDEGGKTDYDNYGSTPACGTGVPDDHGDLFDHKPTIHGDNVNQAAP